jgi:predicted RecB family nuclease
MIVSVSSSTFSPTALASHLSCAHLTQLERQRGAGTLSITFLKDPRVEALQERGRQHEAAYIARLRDEGRTVHDLTESRDPSRTLAAMKAGYGAIVQAPLGNDVFFGIADVLLRCELPSALGGYSYEPVDTKLSRETRASSLLQLATYCELMEAAQGRAPEHFHVVTPLQDETYRLDDFSAYYRLVRSQFRSASTESPAPDTYPDPVAHCDICRYWKYCDDRLRADDHPSLIAGIGRGQVREFQSQQIPTVTAIAKCDGELPSVPKRGRRETYAGFGQQARLQVLARTTSPPPLECLPLEPGRGFARIPEPSPGDIFLDFEGDPFAGENGLEYLTGYHVRDASRQMSLTQEWALDATAEKTACERFIDFATARWKDHPGLHIYHFGAYEPATLKRLCARYETRGEALDRFLRGGVFIDLHTVVREAMRIGVERYGLKELEAMHAFARKQDLAEAAISRRDVELALELGDAAAITDELRDRVARYNAEDCLSTEALRGWLEGQRTQQIAAGIIIDRPPAQPPEPSPEVSERDQRIQSLKEELIAKLPANNDGWSEDDRAIALLASMLGYFRQEEKNALWEHFRLRDLPFEDQLDEREMLAGLQYEETLPKAPRQRNERRRYRFASQECAIRKGDTAVFTKHEDPAGLESFGTTLKVEDIEPARRTVVLSSSGFVAGKHPTAVFCDQLGANVKPLEQSLLAFAEHVRDHGLASTGPFAAASALLRRRPPRPGANGSLIPPDERMLDTARRLSRALDHEVLPIQGPPGSGKTFTGARVILDLARAGKRVGVTAVSHKVIDNLLEAIKEAADEEATPVRLVHKEKGEPPAGIEYSNDSAATYAAVGTDTVVGGTVWLWADDRAADQLDYLFIDEAGQMSLANALAASRSARNLVLLGDPQQLEQPQRGAHPEGADVAALVHVVGKGRKTLARDQGLFLEFTYRLHPAICSFTSELYYENRLHPVAGLERQQVTGATPFAGAGLFLVPVDHDGNQAIAREEIEAVEAVTRSLLSGSTWTCRDGTTRPLVAGDILVVAPYNAQVSALRDRLAPLGVDRVGTVDKFQGQEAPVVIYSCTSSSPEDAPRGMSFLYDPHRFNVATSRAQSVVIVVASPRLFEPECRTPEQMRWANGLCRYREVAQAVSL